LDAIFDDKELNNLYDKLSTKTKGDWKRFALELQKLDDGL
jgi:hypothetical protein